MEDFYKILGVNFGATPEEIQERFRFLAQAFHPDKYSSLRQKQLAEEEFKKINAAYQVLSNPRKRAEYDLSVKRNRYSDDTNLKREKSTRQRAWEEYKRKDEATRQEQKKKEAEIAREKERKQKEAEQRTNREKQRVSFFPKIVAVYAQYLENKHDIAANLAVQVALAGKRVGIFDTDILSPHLLLSFGIDENRNAKTLTDFLHHKATIREIGLSVDLDIDNRISNLPISNITVFLANSKENYQAQIMHEGLDFNKLNEGFQIAINEFNLEYLFVITRSELVHETLLTLAISDIVIVFFGVDGKMLQDASVIADALHELDCPNVFFVADRFPAKYDFDSIKNETEKVLGSKVIGALTNMPEAINSKHNGFFSAIYPDLSWSKSIKDISKILLNV